jgi:hypothetical protein
VIVSYDVLIYTKDRIFGRMLELEFFFSGLSVMCSTGWKKELFGRVVLLDLDDGELPPAGSYESMIGYTRNSAVHSVDLGRKCSLILHRPFEMALLKREVLLLLGGKREQEGSFDEKNLPFIQPTAARLYLLPDKQTLCYGENQVSLSPKEFILIDYLLTRGGAIVPKAQLANLLEAGESNIIEVYVCFLRKKLEELGAPQRIKTVRGKGYRII